MFVMILRDSIIIIRVIIKQNICPIIISVVNCTWFVYRAVFLRNHAFRERNKLKSVN